MSNKFKEGIEHANIDDEPEEINAPNDTSNSVSINDHVSQQHKIKTYPTMLKLISGSLVGGANYNEIYLDPDEEDAFNSCSTNDTDTRNKAKDAKKVPTLPEIARKEAKLQLSPFRATHFFPLFIRF